MGIEICNKIFVLDPESHILFFDIESLIIELLTEEYNMMSPGSLEAAGLISQSEYLKVAALTQSASPDAHKKIVGKLGNSHWPFLRSISRYSCISR